MALVGFMSLASKSTVIASSTKQNATGNANSLNDNLRTFLQSWE
jgi:hypothetical protein